MHVLRAASRTTRGFIDECIIEHLERIGVHVRQKSTRHDLRVLWVGVMEPYVCMHATSRLRKCENRRLITACLHTTKRARQQCVQLQHCACMQQEESGNRAYRTLCTHATRKGRQDCVKIEHCACVHQIEIDNNACKQSISL